MTRLSAFLVLLTASVALADPPSLDIPAEVKPVQGYVKVIPKTDAVSVTYVSLSKVYPIPSDVLKDGRMFLLPAAGLANGRYDFVAVAASKTGEQSTAQFTVVVGDSPVPPVPPGPGPNPPTPPTPTPDQTAPFFGASGLHVLIVWDTTKLLPDGQQGILYDQDNRVFLDSVTPVGPNGQHTWNMWPEGTATANVPPEWKAAYSMPRPSLPWVYVGNGKAGVGAALPANKADFQALVNKYK